MEKFSLRLVLSFFFSVSLFHGAAAMSRRSKDGSEEWGYVEVRPKAHMFWWLYKSSNKPHHSFKPWPTILWLQGGPGSSGVGMGNFVLSWGPLLKDVSRLDKNGLEKSNSIAQKIKQQIRDGLYANATQTWAELEGAITANSNNVDFYNFLLDAGMDAVASTAESSPRTAIEKYSTHLRSLEPLMNGIIRKKLKIIPENVIWVQHSSDVFDALSGDFMKPRIKEVDELLAEGVNVTVYNGQLDVICSTKGAEAWVERLEWEGLENFLITKRRPLYCGEDGVVTKGFTKSYKRLQFYWVLGAGHCAGR